MATLKPISPIMSQEHLNKSVRYIMKPEKTMNGKLISGVNIMAASPEETLEDFQRTKMLFRKTAGRLAYHWEQSFKPGEVDPNIAHELGVEFAKRILPDFEVVVATHVDRDHIHNHFIWNSVSLETGIKYHQPKSLILEYGKISDELCLKYGLSVVPEKETKKKRRSPSFSETHPEEAHKKTIHNFIYEDFDRAMEAAESLDDFFQILQSEMGYRIKRGENVTHTAVAPQGHDFFRLYKFMKGYTEEDIAQRIEAKIQNRGTESNEFAGSHFSAGGREKKESGTQYRQPDRVSYTQFHVRIRYHRYFARRYNRRSLRETYLHYRFALKKVSRGTYPKYPTFELRRELLKLERYSQETVMLVTHGIDNLEQLTAYKTSLDEKVPGIYKEIGRLKSQLNRSRKVPLSNQQRAALMEQIAALKETAALLVREQHLCSDIAERSQFVTGMVNNEKENSLAELEQLRERAPEYER